MTEGRARVERVEPVILAIDEETVVEIDPRSFYVIDGMHHDWQPGSQEGSLSAR